MDSILNLFNDDMIYSLGWTVIHSLWQASLIALIMSFVLSKYQNHKSVTRYRLAAGSLFAVLICALSTFIIYYDQGVSSILLAPQTTLVNGQVETSQFSNSILPALGSFFDKNLGIIVSIWFLGATLFLIKLLGGIFYLKTLVRSGVAVHNTKVYQRFNILLKKLRFRKEIQILESAAIQTPIMLGHLKPIILFPIGLINKLELDEVEAILAHELSHIYRNDYLINIIQSLVEVLFYYHPAVWWISANIKSERENCCDDLAVKLSGNKLKYASALVKLKELEIHNIPTLAIPFSNSNENLFNRIKRIFNQPQNKSNLKEKLIMIAFLFCSVCLFAFSKNHLSEAIKVDESEIETIVELTDPSGQILFTELIVEENIHLDTIPKKKRIVKVEKDDGQKQVKIEMKDGEIESLEIDGKAIPKEDYDKHLKTIEEVRPLARENGFIYSHKDDDGSDNVFILADSIFQDEGSRILKFFGDDVLIDFKKGHGDHDSLNSFHWNFDFDKHDMEDAFKAYDKALRIYDSENGKLFEFNDSIFDRSKRLFGTYDSLKNFWFQHGDSLGNKLEFHFDGPTIWHDGEHDFNYEFLLDSNFNNLYTFPELNSHDFVKPFIYKDRLEKGHDDFNFHWRSSTVQDKIMSELQRDGLVTDTAKEYEIELSGKSMKINGKKMPGEIWQKYKKIYENSVGIELTKKSKLVFKSKMNTKRSFRI